MRHDHHRKEEMRRHRPNGVGGRRLKRTAPAGIMARCRPPSVDMREAQIPLAHVMGDEPLFASLRSLEAGRRDSAELKKLGILGNDPGIGVRSSTRIESELHLNDATMNIIPIRPKKVSGAKKQSRGPGGRAPRSQRRRCRRQSALARRSTASFPASRSGTSRRRIRSSRLKSDRISEGGSHLGSWDASPRTALSPKLPTASRPSSSTTPS